MSEELFRAEQRDWVQSFTENYSDFSLHVFARCEQRRSCKKSYVQDYNQLEANILY